MNRRRTLIATAVGLAASVTAFTFPVSASQGGSAPTESLEVTFTGTTAPVATGHVLPSGERIQEDDERWDCRTMGNRVCGPPTR